MRVPYTKSTLNYCVAFFKNLGDTMPNAVIVGTQWGDEGKAKVIDYLTERSDVIIRFQGGANAGHTVIVEGKKFVFHLVPSGLMYPDKVCLVGNGVVFDTEQFLREVDELNANGISVANRLFVSDLAHLVLPYHKAQDNAAESTMGNGKIGTTGRGIGPAYTDKAARTGIRIADLLDWDLFVSKFKTAFEQKKRLIEEIYKTDFTLNFQQIIDDYKNLRQRIIPFVADTTSYLFDASQKGKQLLFEGAQGNLS